MSTDYSNVDLTGEWGNITPHHRGGESRVEVLFERECEGLEKWPLHLSAESLPVMLQISLDLLACGFCQYMWSINTFVA